MCNRTYEVLQAFDDLPLRYGRWPVQQGRPRGTVVLLGGRSEFMEKYLVTIGELNARRLDVFSFDWRGQGLSGRMLPDRRKGYVECYSQYIRDLDRFLNRVVLPKQPAPVIILAHSMGAHITTRYLLKHTHGVDKVVFTGPMIRIRLNAFSEMVARYVSRKMIRLKMGHVGMPFLLRKDSFRRPFRYNWLTSDAGRFHAIRRMMAENPELQASHLTFGWLDATFQSIDAIQLEHRAEKMLTPALLVVAGRDHVVCNKAIYRFARRLPNHRLETIQGAFHEILQERENYRRQFWRAFDTFIHN